MTTWSRLAMQALSKRQAGGRTAVCCRSPGGRSPWEGEPWEREEEVQEPSSYKGGESDPGTALCARAQQ